MILKHLLKVLQKSSKFWTVILLSILSYVFYISSNDLRFNYYIVLIITYAILNTMEITNKLNHNIKYITIVYWIRLFNKWLDE